MGIEDFIFVVYFTLNCSCNLQIQSRVKTTVEY